MFKVQEAMQDTEKAMKSPWAWSFLIKYKRVFDSFITDIRVIIANKLMQASILYTLESQNTIDNKKCHLQTINLKLF